MSYPASADPNRTSAALEDVRRQLGELRGRADRASALTLLVGAIALILLTVYFMFGLRLLNEFSEPRTLVEQASQILEDKLPEARASLEQQIVSQAPDWAEGLSRRAIDSMPMAREQIETYAMKHLDEVLAKGTLMTEERFRDFLTTNRTEIELSMKDLTTSPDLAEERLAGLERALEQQIQADLQLQFRDAYDGLVLVNEKLGRLRNAENLSEGERLERRVLMLARQIHERQVPMPDARVVPIDSAAGDDALVPAPGTVTRPPNNTDADPAAKLAPAEAEADAPPAEEAPVDAEEPKPEAAEAEAPAEPKADPAPQR